MIANITQHDLWWIVLILVIIVLALAILRRGKLW